MIIYILEFILIRRNGSHSLLDLQIYSDEFKELSLINSHIHWLSHLFQLKASLKAPDFCTKQSILWKWISIRTYTEPACLLHAIIWCLRRQYKSKRVLQKRKFIP